MSLSKSLYAHAPRWAQNLMVSGQGFMHNHRRWDVNLGRRFLAELLDSQWWDEQQFLEDQNRRLKEFVHRAAARVPFYTELFRKHGIDPDSIQTIEDLSRLPILEKRAIREQPTGFLDGGKVRSSWNRLFTSGTTGSPLDLYSSRESFTRIWSFVFRLRSWAGLTDPIFPRRVQFTGRDIVPDKQIHANGVFWRHNIPGNALLMSTSHLSQETVPAYVAAMRSFGPELIDGYPSALTIVARIARAIGLVLPRPRAIITSAETLHPEDRADIEQGFGCAVFDQYASSDTAAFICNCEHGSLHINPEFGVCEILTPDGTPAREGEEGEIVATSFCNTEQVFIRYRIGDLAVAGPSTPCECGRRMPRVEAITGRVDDVLYVPDRGWLGRFDPIFKGLRGIHEAQIVQESLDLIRIKIVAAADFDAAAEAALVVNLRRKVGMSVALEVERVREVPRGPNGKFRSVVSLCRDQYPRM